MSPRSGSDPAQLFVSATTTDGLPEQETKALWNTRKRAPIFRLITPPDKALHTRFLIVVSASFFMLYDLFIQDFFGARENVSEVQWRRYVVYGDGVVHL